MNASRKLTNRVASFRSWGGDGLAADALDGMKARLALQGFFGIRKMQPRVGDDRVWHSFTFHHLVQPFRFPQRSLMVTFRLDMDGFDDLQFLCVFSVILTGVISFESVIIPQQKMFFRFIGQPGIIHLVQIKKMMVGVNDFKIQIKP